MDRVYSCEGNVGDDLIHIFVLIFIFTLVLRCNFGEECALVLSLSLSWYSLVLDLFLSYSYYGFLVLFEYLGAFWRSRVKVYPLNF
jgi:hypothetical protein